jgi:NADP-dependent 3-hydroxy acid dehydrogenase YdfG
MKLKLNGDEQLIEIKQRELRGKHETVVVTGASAGVGRAVVRRFAQEGAHIGLLARGMDGLGREARR